MQGDRERGWCPVPGVRGGPGLCPPNLLSAARPGRRRAQLRRCLEQLKQQVPAGTGTRPTTLSLLHRARLHIQVSPARCRVL